MILVPIKNTASAKQRLASVLDQPARTQLAQAMLTDVLTTLHKWKNRPNVGIVTSDPYTTKLAAEYRFEVIPDPDNPGETGAIEMATRVCVERGEDSTLVIPADIPLIESWELEEIYQHAPAEGSVLVPAGDGRGTNAAFRRPANLFPLRFGNDSFKPHHAAAQVHQHRAPIQRQSCAPHTRHRAFIQKGMILSVLTARPLAQRTGGTRNAACKTLRFRP